MPLPQPRRRWHAPEITHVDGFSQKIILVSVLSSNVVALAIVVLALVL